METYVIGRIDRARADNGDIGGVIERLSPVGYQFKTEPGGYEFSKVGRVESVVTEMVPVCEDHGLDVEDFSMVEHRKSDGSERSRYEQGKILRR